MPSRVSPLWRYGVTTLAGETLVFLDKLASERIITPKLNQPLDTTCTVPSDNPLVNMLHTDGYPFVAEGVRQLYCFRRESDVEPYYTIRGSTLILQVDDAARSDDARTRISAWDPWQYLFFRPLSVPGGETDISHIVPEGGYIYPATMEVGDMVVDIFTRMLDNADPTAPPAAQPGFVDFGQTGFYTLVVPTTATLSDGFSVQAGANVGQTLQDLCATGAIDLEFRPIYDPINRPGILCELYIWSQSAPYTGMGDYNYEAVFSWDKPGRSTVGMDDLFDGTLRANSIEFFNGQGGPSTPLQTDPVSIATYGEYWSLQFFPAQTQAAAVIAIAAEQLALRSLYKQTLTVNPAPERAPEPFVDYYLGDRVPIYASNRLRQALPPAGSQYAFQRVYEIPVEIDDNGTETVRQLVVGPIGPPPPVVGPEALGRSGGSAGGGVALGAGIRGRTRSTTAVLTSTTRTNT